MIGQAGAPAEFRILGPVEVVREGRPLALGGRRQRALLALLLLDPGRPVPTRRLIDELWHGTPPPGADTTLRAYVSRLRAALPGDAVVARAGGYAIEVESDRLDARRFEQELRRGRDLLRGGAAGLAAEALRSALALWRGAALIDVADGGSLDLEARRLDELRLSCIEERMDAELALGAHAELVSELERLVAEEPLRERFWRQLIVALYRSERQADALDAYRRAQSLLSKELGLEPSEELRALERAVLRHEVPQSPPAEARHNLPAPLTSFVGREQELAEIAHELRKGRLVTLTGTGGAGKTRLALEVAHEQARAWRDGVWFVDLASVTDPALVSSAVVDATGASERPDRALLDVLTEHLRHSETLLVLDNCEHLLDPCAELVYTVLRACASVRVLATSRAPLELDGEHEYPVHPLPTPPEDATAGDPAPSASVQLFIDRATAVRRDLAADATHLTDVARICRELDGLPLAIELAAARAGHLSIGEIARRLDDRLGLLRSRRRMVDPRHQTIRATIDWSFALLSDEERLLLGRLSVFVGGFDVPSTAAVCLDGDDERARALIEQLIEWSLVVPTGRRTDRYHLLETIRAYATERLESSRTATTYRHLHAERYLALARAASPDYVRFDPRKQADGLAALDLERANLHAALEWALSTGDETALPLAAELRHYWLIRGYVRQGHAWLERALAVAPPEQSRVRAEALAGAALLARLAGELGRAETLAREGLTVARATASLRPTATSLNVLTAVAGMAGDYDRAEARCREAVAVARKMGSRRTEAIALFILAEAALNARMYEETRAAGGRALELSRAGGDREGTALALVRLGIAGAQEGREEAAAQLLEALEHANELGFPGIGASACYGLALLAARNGDGALAARLVRAAENLQGAAGSAPIPAELAVRDEALALARGSRLDTAALEADHASLLAELLIEARRAFPHAAD